MNTTHGGDTTSFRRRYGREPLDFSASLNPLGMPRGVAAAARRAAGTAEAYPDPLCRDLCAALAARTGVAAEGIVCGNGAADIIHRLVLAKRPRRALVTAPSFAEYRAALELVACRVDTHELRRADAFRLDERYLDSLQPGLDTAFLCQPNNPTGGLASRDLLLAALERCEKHGTLLVVDECFVPFVDSPEDATLLPWLNSHPCLFLLGSFTKLYAMAGLRLGYGLTADIALARALVRAGQPWAVSTPAQAAGIAALAEEAYVARSLAYVRRERGRLRRGLAKLGITAAGEANYLFFHCAAPCFSDAMAEEGILIRDCRNFPGLGEGDYRIAVRTRAENDRFLAAVGLREW